MPPTFFIFLAFMAAAFVAPLILIFVLVLMARPKWRGVGMQLVIWGSIGAAGFALGNIAIGVLIDDPPTLSGTAVGACAGFTLAVFLSAARQLIFPHREKGLNISAINRPN